MALKQYEIEINGIKHTVQLRPDDVEHYPNAVEVKVGVPANKAVTPQNK
jgi:hypothetical protein